MYEQDEQNERVVNHLTITKRLTKNNSTSAANLNSPTELVEKTRGEFFSPFLERSFFYCLSMRITLHEVFCRAKEKCP